MAEQDEEATQQSVARSTALMSVATLLSRITGLVRTWAMAFALGNSLITSAFQVANNMPNVVYDLVAGGLLGAAFIPVFMSEKERKGPEGGNEFAGNLLNAAIIVLGVLSVICSIFSPQLIATQTFTVGDTAEVTRLSVEFFRIFAFQILFYGISGVVTAALNANRVYFLPAIAPAFNNICVIVSFFAYIPLSAIDGELAITVLAVGTTLGVAVQAVVQIPALIKQGFHFSFKVNWRDPALIEALKIAVPTFIYIVGTLVAYSCRNAFSLQASDIGPSTLNYAWTWYQLPYGVIAVSLSRALFTEMGEAVAKGNMELLRDHVHNGIATTLLLIIPLAGMMIVLSVPIMQLFQAGAFGADDVYFVASILALWTISLPFYSVLMFLYNVYASIRKFMRFALVSTFMVIAQCLLYAILCRNDMLGLAGIPAADFIYYSCCSIVLVILLQREIGSFGMKGIMGQAVKVVAATLIAMVAAGALELVIPSDAGMLSGFVSILVCGTVGVVCAFGLCSVFKIPEMSVINELLKRLKGKLSRKHA